MARPIRRDDFELADDSILHVPSGAVFWLEPDAEFPHQVTWGTATEADPDGGGGASMYDIQALLAAAILIHRERALLLV